MYSLRTLSCEEDMTLPNDQLSMTSCKWKSLLTREEFFTRLAITWLLVSFFEKYFRSDFFGTFWHAWHQGLQGIELRRYLQTAVAQG